MLGYISTLFVPAIYVLAYSRWAIRGWLLECGPSGPAEDVRL